MLNSATIELNLHGMNRYQAKTLIDSRLRRSKGVYTIRLIHGHNRGTSLRDMIDEEYSGDPRVIRLARVSEGCTELVLREL